MCSLVNDVIADDDDDYYLEWIWKAVVEDKSSLCTGRDSN